MFIKGVLSLVLLVVTVTESYTNVYLNESRELRRNVSFSLNRPESVGNRTNSTPMTKTFNRLGDDNGTWANAFDACQKDTRIRNVLIAVFATVVLVAGIIGNSLSIIVIMSSASLRKQGAYLLISSLAVADMGVSVFVTTTKVDMYRHNNSFCHGMEVCYLLTFMDYFFPMSSVLHLLAVAFDRFAAIVMPYFHYSHFTKSVTKMIIACVWLYAILWACLGMFPWSSKAKSLNVATVGEGRICYALDVYYTTTVAIVIYFIPMTISTCLHSAVLRVAFKQAVAIHKSDQIGKKKRKGRFSRDLRAFRTITIVFAAYIICWLPHFIIILIGYWTPWVMENFMKANRTTYDAVTTLFNNALPTLNSCINPFIYFISSNQFRIGLKDLLYKLLKKPRNGFYYPEVSAFSTVYKPELSKRNANANIECHV